MSEKGNMIDFAAWAMELEERAEYARKNVKILEAECVKQDKRIAELEAALRAIAEYHSWCRGRPIGLAYQPEFHTERRDFALKALEGGAGK